MDNLIRSLRERNLLQSDSLESAIRNTDIRNFIAPELRESSYLSFLTDRPALAVYLPDVQRTISAPHMVCMMLEQLLPEPNQKYLILGSKFGYLATLVYKMCHSNQITILEANTTIFHQTKQNLEQIRLHQQISVIKKNPLEGLLGQAPFHRILITGAVEEVPDTIFSQLADGGKMLVPVGSPTQDLILYTKSEDFLEEMNLCSVVFSPLETFIASQTGTS